MVHPVGSYCTHEMLSNRHHVFRCGSRSYGCHFIP